MIKNTKALIVMSLIFIMLLAFFPSDTRGVFAADEKTLSEGSARGEKANYKDVAEESWFSPAVRELSLRGFVCGYPDGTFKPDGIVTFGEFIKMMVMANDRLKPFEEQAPKSSGASASKTNAVGIPDKWASVFYDQGLDQGLYTKWDIEEDDLAKSIPRKYMALIIGAALGDRTIPGYKDQLEKIRDIQPGDKFEFDLMKTYDAGILSGYPDGSFAPNKTLTRAEAAMAVYRFVGPGLSDYYWAKDPDYPAMETWYNGSNISVQDTNIYWLENRQFKPQVRGQFRLEAGKLRTANNQDFEAATILGKGQQVSAEWTLSGTDYKNINEDIYKVLKAYWKIAAKEGYFITISGGRGLSYDTISIILCEKDAPNFPRTASFSFNDGKAPMLGKVQPFVIFDMGMNYRLREFEALAASAEQKTPAGSSDWRDTFLVRGRILNPELAELNRKLLVDIYGQNTGAELYDFALNKYKRQYEKEKQGAFLKLINLSNEVKTIGDVVAYFDDDATSRITLYIGGK